MPPRAFRPKLRPGFDQSDTRLGAEGAWWDGDKVRFQHGQPENMRGWQRKHDDPFHGTVRCMHAWLDLRGVPRIAMGTECLLEVYDGGLIYDITPVRSTTVATSILNVSADSLRVVVSDTHGMATAGDFLVFTSMAATVGGNVFLAGRYHTSVIDANSFAVDVSTSAVSNASGVGLVTLNYLVTCGTSVAAPGYGWGAGGYGEGTWGTPRSASSIILDIQQWSFDNFGEDLVANIRGGNVYLWNASAGVSVRASVIPEAPSRSNFILVSPEDRHLISFGGTDVLTSVFDPLLVQWADTESYAVWLPTVTNTAGSLRLTDGSKIVGAERSRGQINTWTDNAVFALSFVGPPYTFGVKLLGTNCGLVGPHAAIDVNGRSYWMGLNHNFFVYDGRVRPLDCPVLDKVFLDLNRDQISKVYAGSNSEFGEIVWLYPSLSATECDRYVIYNTEENCWYTGTFSWTAMVDQGVFDNPLTAGTNGYLYDHEIHGVYTSDGAAIESYVESGDFDLEDGQSMLFVSENRPDFNISGGNLHFYIMTKRYPGEVSAVVKGPYTISAGTTKLNLRARGRVARIRYVASGAGISWRGGANTFIIQDDGQR
jgi:hypothetical protein